MKAVIMAGGVGSRLKPLTCDIPKPLIPVANRPVMEYIVELLKSNGINKICATLQYLPNKIKDNFGDGSEFNVEMKYYVEGEPLGTAGSIKNVGDFLDETFIVISGDVLTDFDLKKAIEFHKNSGSMATIVLTRVKVPLEYGVIIADEHGKIVRFLEKPSWSEVFSDTVNTGIYILEPEVLNYIEKGKQFDFSKDLFPLLLKEKKPMFGYVAEGYWCDIGNLTQYMDCHQDILNGIVNVNINESTLRAGVWVGKDIEFGENIKIHAPVIIGNNVKIGNNVEIYSGTVIGDNTVIEDFSSIKKSIIWSNSYIGKYAELRGTVIGHRVQLKEKVKVFENSVIGDDCLVKDECTIKPDVKIWPNKLIEVNCIVSNDIIWGTRYKKNLFGYDGISGKTNVEITPEFGVKLGATLSSVIKGNIGISCDDAIQSSMLKRAIISGLMSSGAKIYDFGTMILPMMRAAVKDYKLKGAVHIKSVDSDKIVFDILDEKGGNIDKDIERKIENNIAQGDLKRCAVDKISEVFPVPDYDKIYIINLLNSIDVYDIRNSHFTVKYKVDSGFLNNVLQLVLNFCGCMQSDKPDVEFYMDTNGETLALKGSNGKMLSEENMTALRSYLTIEAEKDVPVVIPINIPDAISDMIKANNRDVILSKTTLQDRMHKILDNEKDGTWISQFRLNFDALSFLLKLLEVMAVKKISLKEIEDKLPKFYMEKQVVECNWDSKGKIIRNLIEENHVGNDAIEGVKIKHDGGWAMVLPDPELPACRLFVQGYNEEYAKELTDMYVKKIRSIDNEMI